MNILHIISGGEVGGSKNHLLSLVKGMENENAKSIIVCFIKGELYSEAKEMGLDVRLVEQIKRVDLTVVNSIKQICIQEKIDIINCHGGRANFVGWFLKRRYHAKYVTTVHSDYRDDYRGNTYKTYVYSNINRQVLKKFDYYITVSDNFKKMLADRGYNENRIFVVYNGLDFDRKKPLLDREKIINKYHLKQAGHYVSMIARFHPVKGHKVFLEACRIVLEKNRDVQFIFIGDGDILEEIKAYGNDLGIGENLSFAGWQVPDEFIFISDFTALASYTESFPLVILESARYDKTVVSTDVGGVSKLIKDGTNGYIVEPGDYKDMAEKMLLLLKDSKMTVDFGRSLGQKARENYSIGNMVSSYMEIYRTITTEEKSNE